MSLVALKALDVPETKSSDNSVTFKDQAKSWKAAQEIAVIC